MLTELVSKEEPSEEAKKKAEHMSKYDDMLRVKWEHIIQKILS